MNPAHQVLPIRRGVPSDARELAAVHCTCFLEDDHLARSLGPRFLRKMYTWLASSSRCGLFVVESERGIIGATSIFDGSYEGAMVRALKWELVATPLRNPKVLANRSLWRAIRAKCGVKRSMQAIGPPEKAPCAQILYTMVDESQRGRGYAGALRSAALQWARDRGVRRAITGVHFSNTSSLRANERDGFRPLQGEPDLRGFIYLYVDL